MKLKPKMIPTGSCYSDSSVGGQKSKTDYIIGTKRIRDSMEAGCLQQAINDRSALGVTDMVVNPDAHQGYGTPIGCVLVSPTHVYPGPVGVDIKCSMSLIQFDLPQEIIKDKKIRRELINAITKRIPTGAGAGQKSIQET